MAYMNDKGPHIQVSLVTEKFQSKSSMASRPFMLHFCELEFYSLPNVQDSDHVFPLCASKLPLMINNLLSLTVAFYPHIFNTQGKV